MGTRSRRGGVRCVAALWVAMGCISCGGKSSNSPSSNVCSEISVSQSGDVAIIGCSSVRSSVSNIAYDRFSRAISYNFNITCTSNNKTFAGDVSLNYNNVGQVISSTVRVNGQTCQK